MRIVSNGVWSNPPVDGLEIADGEWRLDAGRYDRFLEAATGMSPDDELSPSDCYRIANRLEALVERHKRSGDSESALVEAYPDVQSLETFVWLARFFRRCHDCTRETDGSCLSTG
jgi:hypothetical protein